MFIRDRVQSGMGDEGGPSTQMVVFGIEDG